jgi:hypothetical protein
MPYGKPLAGVCLATAVFVCSAIGAPSLPGSPPPPNAPLTLTSSGGSATLTAGTTVTMRGSGFAPNANISIGIYSSPIRLDAVTADATGAFSDAVSIPASFSGSHTLVAEGNAPDGSPRVLSSSITVRAAATSGSLPFTGARTALLALSGLGLVVAGFALVRAAALARRRSRRRAALGRSV